MVIEVTTGTLHGLEARAVRAEISQRRGIKRFTYIGLPTAVVRESKDRIVRALDSAGLPCPGGDVLISLAPADLRKDGGALDLPLALGVLATQRVVPSARLRRWLVAGELALTGSVRPIRGGLALARLAGADGRLDGAILPAETCREIEPFVHVDLVGVHHVTEAVRFLADGTRPEPLAPLEPVPRDAVPDLGDVRGQAVAKRALVVAAAGGHSLLFVGPPGAGKSMLARRMPGVLPPLDDAAALDCALIASAVGRPRHPADRRPPFRAPHHTVSRAGLLGGGTAPAPGEVSFAHRGVLFLDELPEFARGVLESLRECLETRESVVTRAGRVERFPAAFQLVAAMNPCPCGFAGHPTRACACDPGRRERYGRRISGALRDRIDVQVGLGPVDPVALEGGCAGETSADAAARVSRARDRQRARNDGCLNHSLSGARLLERAALDAEATTLLRASARKLGLSARAYHRVVRVARTVADLDGDEAIGAAAIAEAVGYRLR